MAAQGLVVSKFGHCCAQKWTLPRVLDSPRLGIIWPGGLSQAHTPGFFAALRMNGRVADAAGGRDCERHDRCGGASFEVHLTPGAIDALRIEEGKEVWLVIKTYSYNLVEPSAR